VPVPDTQNPVEACGTFAHSGNPTRMRPAVAENVPFHVWVTVVPEGSLNVALRPPSAVPAGPVMSSRPHQPSDQRFSMTTRPATCAGGGAGVGRCAR
jgi:hypothetical protein